MTQHRVATTSTAIVVSCAVAVLAAACSQAPLAPSALGAAATSGPSLFQRAGDGNTPSRLTQAGWHCVNVPGHGVHCEDPHAEIGSSVHIQVKVFDTSDVGSDSAAFLGTESLMRADHYHGQPCLPGHGEYFLLPFGYYACHHFDF
jgi:hypothetical protein